MVAVKRLTGLSAEVWLVDRLDQTHAIYEWMFADRSTMLTSSLSSEFDIKVMPKLLVSLTCANE